MPTINRAFKEISCKIVYYGPGLGGKTTNLQVVHKQIPPKHRGDLVSLATEADRTLFFDFLPLDLGEVKGFKTKFQLYTVPGQVFYNATRKLVLRGVDGVVFVADSQADRLEDSIESLNNLNENLQEYGLDIDSIPLVLQYNKRDLPNILSIDELNRAMNPLGKYLVTEAVAFEGTGVKETLKAISGLVLARLNDVNQGGRPQAQQSKLAEAAMKRRMGPGAGSPAGESGPPMMIPPPASLQNPGLATPGAPPVHHTPMPSPVIQAHTPAPAAPAPPAEPKLMRVRQDGATYWRGIKVGSSSLELTERRNKDGRLEYQLTGIVKGIFRKKYWSKTLDKVQPPADNTPKDGGFDYFEERLDSRDGNPKVEAWLSTREPRELFVRESSGSTETAPMRKRVKDIL